ncbi:MAG: LamG domain-containing protein [Lentisphaerae bacterium]|nr:LamG domain-containing protein [Lentisphaerota bacterium]
MNVRRAGIAAAFLGFALAAWAGESSNETVRVSMDLVDGSRLIGTARATTVRLVSAIGKIDLPIGRIRSVQFNPDRETAVVVFENGDRLTGVMDLRTLTVDALFGKVEVPPAQCRSIAFMGGRGDAGLVLHYTFDEDAEEIQDRSGLGHDGYWAGAPVYEAGIKGKAARFRSKDTYLVAPSPELNMNGWNGMTVCLWVKAASHTTYAHVINRGPLTTDKQGAFELGIGQGYKRGLFVVQNNPANPCPTVIAGAENLPLNRWCHLAGTYDGEFLRYYVDGKLEKETRIAASPTPVWDSQDTKLVIGNMSRLPFINWSDMFFDGLVDEVRIFRRALSEDEIKQIGDLPK